MATQVYDWAFTYHPPGKEHRAVTTSVRATCREDVETYATRDPRLRDMVIRDIKLIRRTQAAAGTDEGST